MSRDAPCKHQWVPMQNVVVSNHPLQVGTGAWCPNCDEVKVVYAEGKILRVAALPVRSA